MNTARVVSAILLTAAVAIISGCASKPQKAFVPPPMPEHPSVALQFARAAHLWKMNDYPAGQYLVFNDVDEGFLATIILPLKKPVLVGQKEEFHTSNADIDLLAGAITGSWGVPILSILSEEHPQPFVEGFLYFITWGDQDGQDDKDAEQKIRKLNEILLSDVSSFSNFTKFKDCTEQPYYKTHLYKTYKNEEFYTDIPVKPGSMVYVFRTSRDCITIMAYSKDNAGRIAAMAEKLGDSWAIFSPGSQEIEPRVYWGKNMYRFVPPK